MFCWTRDITLWRSAWMTSAQLWSRRHHWPWADVIRADFQTVISRYLQNVNTRLFCTADRMFRTIIILNSRLIYACFPIKIDEVWIDRFCVRYDWWRRLQPTSSVSPVWYPPAGRRWWVWGYRWQRFQKEDPTCHQGNKHGSLGWNPTDGAARYPPGSRARHNRDHLKL